MGYRKTRVDINSELLIEVQRALETSTIRETVEEAFREVLRHRARTEEVRVLRQMDGLDLAEAGVMAGAWRS